MNGNQVMTSRCPMLMVLTLLVVSILTLILLFIVYKRIDYQVSPTIVTDREIVLPKQDIVRPRIEYASRSISMDVHNKTEMEMVVTAYSSEDPGVGNITYSGIPVDRGAAAVDPNVIPIGSVIYVPGYGYAIAVDIGGLIKGKRIDVYFPSRREAVNWGVKRLKVTIFGMLGVDENGLGKAK